MKIAFIGIAGSLSYERIGGTESIVRRLSHQLIAKGEQVDIISYNEKTTEIVEVNPQLKHFKFSTFDEMLTFIKQKNISLLFTIFIGWGDKIKLNKFISANPSIRFSSILTNYKPSFIKRWIYNLETRITYRNGQIFCISDRILNGLKAYSKNAQVIMPPVEDFFFHDKIWSAPQGRKIRLAYMGRLDYGKGADIAVSFFNNNNLDDSKYEYFVYSYPWENDELSMKLHNELKNQSKINYIETNVHKYTPEVDQFLLDTIDAVDIFILPYRYVHSTVDSPMVPLEIMSRNKIFLTSDLKGLEHLTPNPLMKIKPEEFSDDTIEKRILEIFSNFETIQKDILNFKNNTPYRASEIASQLLSSFN